MRARIAVQSDFLPIISRSEDKYPIRLKSTRNYPRQQSSHVTHILSALGVTHLYRRIFLILHTFTHQLPWNCRLGQKSSVRKNTPSTKDLQPLSNHGSKQQQQYFQNHRHLRVCAQPPRKLYDQNQDFIF